MHFQQVKRRIYSVAFSTIVISKIILSRNGRTVRGICKTSNWYSNHHLMVENMRGMTLKAPIPIVSKYTETINRNRNRYETHHEN